LSEIIWNINHVNHLELTAPVFGFFGAGGVISASAIESFRLSLTGGVAASTFRNACF
jgi:hypothetical protein